MLLYGCGQSPVSGQKSGPHTKQYAKEEEGQKEQGDTVQKNAKTVPNSAQGDNIALAPEELLEMKLNDQHKDKELSATESISLIEHCVQLGDQPAARAIDKVTCLVMGITGSGKSTAINALLGCRMQQVDPSDLGLPALEDVVVVDPASSIKEVMPIGHEGRSTTFMPKVVLDPNNRDKAYCDCPGFNDNRGSEINMANAINIKRVLHQSRGVKTLFLTSYNSLTATRGAGVRNMQVMCEKLFGSVDNLRRYQDSVLVGITKAPLTVGETPVTLDRIRRLFTAFIRTEVTGILSARLFLLDPLERGGEDAGFSPLSQWRTKIDALTSIPQDAAGSVFQTILTDNDQVKLKHILRDRANALSVALKDDNYELAGRHWQSISRLNVIDNDEIDKLIGEHALSSIQRYVSGCVAAFKQTALGYQFEEAERQLALLHMLSNHFPNADLKVDLQALASILQEYKNKSEEEQRTTNQKIEAAKRAGIQQARAELEQQIQHMLAQLENKLQQSSISAHEQQRILQRANQAGKEVLEGIGNS